VLVSFVALFVGMICGGVSGYVAGSKAKPALEQVSHGTPSDQADRPGVPTPSPEKESRPSASPISDSAPIPPAPPTKSEPAPQAKPEPGPPVKIVKRQPRNPSRDNVATLRTWLQIERNNRARGLDNPYGRAAYEKMPDLPAIREHARKLFNTDRFDESTLDRLLDWLCVNRGITLANANQMKLSEVADLLDNNVDSN
jgi:hypothetical protein